MPNTPPARPRLGPQPGPVDPNDIAPFELLPPALDDARSTTASGSESSGLSTATSPTTSPRGTDEQNNKKTTPGRQ